jgi:pyridoxamine 5'-phosphate oxidase
MNLAEFRKDYIKHSLDVMVVGNDPVNFFSGWLNEAIQSGVQEPTAMAVSSVSADGKPSSRMVLLKGIEEGKFKFFTNYNSRKGQELNINPNMAMLFFWPELERQVRIEGKVEKIPGDESDIYFNSRPLESRLGAIASPQSKVISGREELEELYNNLEETILPQEVERPDYWGGYSLKPDSVEFWQGRPGRLHDRIRFRKEGNTWIVERLAP